VARPTARAWGLAVALPWAVSQARRPSGRPGRKSPANCPWQTAANPLNSAPGRAGPICRRVHARLSENTRQDPLLELIPRDSSKRARGFLLSEECVHSPVLGRNASCPRLLAPGLPGLISSIDGSDRVRACAGMPLFGSNRDRKRGAATGGRAQQVVVLPGFALGPAAGRLEQPRRPAHHGQGRQTRESISGSSGKSGARHDAQ